MRRNVTAACCKVYCECDCHSVKSSAPPMSSGLTPSESGSGFPFLKLPPEIRNMIYQKLLLPAGDQRSSPYYVGKVHLPILQTCQQIYQEARDIPLSGDTLWFTNQVDAHIFLYRFLGHPHLARITSMRLDLSQEEITCAFFPFLCEDHAKVLPSLNRLFITVKGKIDERDLGQDSTFMKGMEAFRGLKSFGLELPYLGLPQSVKDDAVERFKQRLLIKREKETPMQNSPPQPVSDESDLEDFLREVQVPEDNNKEPK